MLDTEGSTVVRWLAGMHLFIGLWEMQLSSTLIVVYYYVLLVALSLYIKLSLEVWLPGLPEQSFLCPLTHGKTTALGFCIANNLLGHTMMVWKSCQAGKLSSIDPAIYNGFA